MSRQIPRIMTVAGIMSDIDDDGSESVTSDPSSSSAHRDRIIIVANQLPIKVQRKSDNSKGWTFTWDDNSLLLQLKDGLGDEDVEFIYVGCLKEDIHPNDQDEVSQILLETFKCVPTFLPPDLFSRYYHGFCKQQLWPLFHYMLPLSPDLGGRFNRSLWQAYVSVNKIFADRIMEVINPEDDFVWVHDYHLMVLPTFLRKRFNRVKLGFFLHSPFPSSEIYKTLPIREELLRALLNSDLIGFHTFDYARHFLSCCSRMLVDKVTRNWIRCWGSSVHPKKEHVGCIRVYRCSPSLSGAIRVNPWNIDVVAEAMDSALVMAEPEKQLRHEKHYKYVSTHDVAYWARSFLHDLERTCKDHVRRRCWGIGFGLSFRVVALDPNFRKLAMEHIVSAYRRTTTRAILLDYDGTLMPQNSIDKKPSLKTLEIIKNLCRDKNNMVFIVSTRRRDTLDEWFSSCEKLGIAAEHGYFVRMKRDEEWETCVPEVECNWKQIAEPVMHLYTETTDGSVIEYKETAMGWCYEDADPDFGSCQAKELLDHLESVLANEPVTVKSGSNCVEVKPQGVSKGLVAKRLLSSMQDKGMSPDFVLCIGDDRSDEDMFEVITSSIDGPSIAPRRKCLLVPLAETHSNCCLTVLSLLLCFWFSFSSSSTTKMGLLSIAKSFVYVSSNARKAVVSERRAKQLKPKVCGLIFLG
ncbi:hypothetical protein DH2020_043820 [Rehmannia glutinosa]|uniref:Uncharacterized protein n=1 Tax=Rehmannia glutinosa TaxID=99300 RepID=A0ABR0UJF5_REHGL